MPTHPAFIELERLLSGTVSLFVSARSKLPPQTITFADYLDGVRNGRWREQVEAVREANARSKAEADRVKIARLPAIKPSGIFRGLGAGDFVKHSGILCIDLDDVGPALAETRKRLQSLPCVVAIHLSPRATGLKVFLAVMANDAEKHRGCFHAAVIALRKVMPDGVKIDPAPSNVASNCFVSYDPEAWVATTPRVPISPSSCEEPASTFQGLRNRSHSPKVGPRGGRREGVISEESISVFIGKILSPEASPYFEESQFRDRNAKTRQRARRALSKLPHRLRAIYRQFIESKPVNRGERHAFLTRVIPPMFEVVAEPVLLDLLCRHHRAQMGTWRTDLDDHMQEAEKMLADYGPKYRTMLSERERIVFYDRLSDGKRMAALRICRGLARSEKAQKSGFFFLACSELAVRIGCHPDTAHFILREFKAEGVIERIKIGDVCSTQALGERKRKATTWRWMASLGLAAFAGENISHESAGDNEKPRFLSQGPDDKTRQAES